MGDPGEIADGSVTYAKIQDVSGPARVLGRKTAGAGPVEECTISELLEFLGGTARGDLVLRGAAGWERIALDAAGRVLESDGTDAAWMMPRREFAVAVSNETTALTTGTGKLTFRMPYGMTLTAVRASVRTAPTGAKVTVNIKEAGTTIFSTKLTIDIGAKTSVGAAIPAVISDAALADDAEMTIDIDTVGSSVAGDGLKVTFLGRLA